MRNRVYTITIWGSLMVGTSTDHLSHVFGLLINGCGSDHRALGRGNIHHHLNWTSFRQLAKKLIEVRWVLKSERKKRRFKLSRYVFGSYKQKSHVQKYINTSQQLVLVVITQVNRTFVTFMLLRMLTDIRDGLR